MPLLQKITRPRVRILGTEYSARIVGLHNRVRAHAGRLLVYKDIVRLGGRSAERSRGVFVAEPRRLVVYLRKGASERTVAHELMHALLWTEGFLPIRCAREDLRRHPALGDLAAALHDLLVHPILEARLARLGYPEPPGRHAPGGSLRQIPASAPFEREPALLRALAAAVRNLEARCRAGFRATAGLRRTGSLGGLVHDIARIAGWDPSRTPLEARSRAARILHRIDAAAAAEGIALSLGERLILPAWIRASRLGAPARSLFGVRAGGPRGRVVLLLFRPDRTVCSAREFHDAARAARAVEAVGREIASSRAIEILERHRLEHLVIERRERSAPGGARPRRRWRCLVRTPGSAGSGAILRAHA